jgi:3-oxoacyl-[acyl-carrier protein] reductase
MFYRLDNEIALVTGASRGLGRAIALQLGALGATVIGTATTEGGANGIQAALEGASIKGAGWRTVNGSAPWLAWRPSGSARRPY